ncbi:MAG: type I DNA topoisomerase [Bacteroidetes bacterium]|nr:type I DNA topoisomerase [Bacteroidota bacterium]
MAKITKTKKTTKATTKNASGKTLIIVESPSKSKTISKYLGDKYIVEASIGHIRDLRKFAMGIDIDNDFTPIYQTIRGKTGTVKLLQKIASTADNVLIATDPDREGEAIAWHIAEILNDAKKDIKRVEFNEITKKAIKIAIDNPRKIDENLFQSQQARRVLDRIIGFKISPFLSNLMLPITTDTLSAGRVQSVAMRLICEREDLINAFEPIEYWTINAEFNTDNADKLSSKLISLNGKTIKNPEGSKKDFNADSYHYIRTKEEADEIIKQIKKENFCISSITKKQIKKRPASPFTTSLLQQDASHKLGFSSRKTMQVAQNLYEGISVGKDGVVGLITYMRTDSVRVSKEAAIQAREFIVEQYGTDYLPDNIPVYKSKSSAVQDAHEAIRPTFITYTPDSISSYLSAEQLDLYRLIYNRFLASQMVEAKIEQTSIDINGGDFVFRSTGSVIVFKGYLVVYNDNNSDNDKDILPKGLKENDHLELYKIIDNETSTKPPPRYNEASLVKELDERGIGRPSTYAQIVSTLLDRKYVELQSKAFFTTHIGQEVNKILIRDFPALFNVDFTANMENDLDKIAAGNLTYLSLMQSFYKPFEEQLNIAEQKEQPSKIKCELCEHDMVIKISRRGRFLGCSNYPNCNNIKTLASIKSGGEEKKQPTIAEGIMCDKCGSQMYIRTGKFGDFYGCSKYPECDYIKQMQTPIGCPKCSKGSIVGRYSPKNKKRFWACNQYPQCNYIANNEPLNEKCSKCDNPYLEVRYKKVNDGFEKYKSCPTCKEKFNISE